MTEILQTKKLVCRIFVFNGQGDLCFAALNSTPTKVGLTKFYIYDIITLEKFYLFVYKVLQRVTKIEGEDKNGKKES